ncbi:chondrolectin isoform X3 [Lissotriton helveticus]
MKKKQELVFKLELQPSLSGSTPPTGFWKLSFRVKVRERLLGCDCARHWFLGMIPRMLPALLGAILCWQNGHAQHIVSGQKVCLGNAHEPCYKIAYFHEISRRLGFEEARQACEIGDGVLLSLESEAEQTLIKGLLQNLTKPGSGISDGDFWIGLWRNGRSQTSASSCSDMYEWVDGTSSNFRNWYIDEPSCGSEACVVMYHQPTANPGIGGPYLYQWNDDRCNMKHNFICKYIPETFPTTTVGKPLTSTKAEDSYHVVISETGIMPNLIYVIIPTIPLLLLILVAFGTCCFQMLHKSKERTKTSPTQSTLWISKTPRTSTSMEV